MAQTTTDKNLSHSELTDKSNQEWRDPADDKDAWEVEYKDTDGPTGFQETTYDFEWRKWHGYYRTVPEYGAAIDTLCEWIIGKEIEAEDEKTRTALNKIDGWGKDTSRDVLENCLRVSLMAGDSIGEIVRDNGHRITNIIPRNLGSIQLVVNSGGRLKKYNQIGTVKTEAGDKKDEIFASWKPKQILHLSLKRTGDEMHGVPLGEKLEETIKMKQETEKNLQKVFRRYVKPMQFIYVNTDDKNEIKEFKKDYNEAYDKTENVIIPSETIDRVENVSIPQFSSLDPMPWLKELSRQFTTDVGVPEVVRGWGENTTEASAKIIYTAYQQRIESYQRWFEKQIEAQTGLKIKLKQPPRLDEQMQEDERKDGQLNANMETDPSKKTN